MKKIFFFIFIFLFNFNLNAIKLTNKTEEVISVRPVYKVSYGDRWMIEKGNDLQIQSNTTHPIPDLDTEQSWFLSRVDILIRTDESLNKHYAILINNSSWLRSDDNFMIEKINNRFTAVDEKSFNERNWCIIL